MKNMTKIKSLGVFCGSASGNNPAYIESARTLGTLLGENGIRLVYGAGHVGMMGAVAEATLKAGGQVTGIINELLQSREEQKLELSELQILPSLHIRKNALFDSSDAFCILPGGIGTLDEVFEIVTLKQLGEHVKPIVMCNVNGFWEPYRRIIDSLIHEGFVKPSDAGLVTYVDRAEDVLPAVEAEIERAAGIRKAV